MPIVFGFAGILLIVAGVRGQTTQLFSLVKSDFSGQPNYFEWMMAIFLIGVIGYIKELSTISRMFMILVAAGLLYKNKQVFSQADTQATANPAPVQTNPAQAQPATLYDLKQPSTVPQANAQPSNSDQTNNADNWWGLRPFLETPSFDQ
jgi:hypothetical protein